MNTGDEHETVRDHGDHGLDVDNDSGHTIIPGNSRVQSESKVRNGLDSLSTEPSSIPNGVNHAFELSSSTVISNQSLSSQEKNVNKKNIDESMSEEFLYQHPAISEVQVFGIPDEKMGEQVCAWVQLNEGMALTEDELKAYCKDQITHFKIPRYVRFVTEYPMTVTGKIQKFVMRDQMVEMLENA